MIRVNAIGKHSWQHSCSGGQKALRQPCSHSPLTRWQAISQSTGLETRLAAIVDRYPWLEWPLAVTKRASAVGAGPASASIALVGFLSLFPLLVVAVAILGFFSANDADFAQRTVENLGLTGDTADTVVDAIDSAERNRKATSILGLAGLAWSGLAVTSALESAINSAWQAKGRGLKSRPLAVLWLAGIGALLASATALTHLLSSLPGPVAFPSLVVSLAVDIAVFLTMFVGFTNLAVGWRAHLPGAVMAATGFMVLKLVSSVYVPRLVESSSLYGSIGAVLALLAWLVLVSKLVVYSAVVNVVAYERQHGTVTAEIQVPRVAGQVPLATTRNGAVDQIVERATPT